MHTLWKGTTTIPVGFPPNSLRVPLIIRRKRNTHGGARVSGLLYNTPTSETRHLDVNRFNTRTRFSRLSRAREEPSGNFVRSGKSRNSRPDRVRTAESGVTPRRPIHSAVQYSYRSAGQKFSIYILSSQIWKQICRLRLYISVNPSACSFYNTRYKFIAIIIVFASPQ